MEFKKKKKMKGRKRHFAMKPVFNWKVQDVMMCKPEAIAIWEGHILSTWIGLLLLTKMQLHHLNSSILSFGVEEGDISIFYIYFGLIDWYQAVNNRKYYILIFFDTWLFNEEFSEIT